MGDLGRELGKRVRQLREAAGLTQEEFAKRAGMDYKYIGGIERGERANITLDTVAKLMRALDVEAHEMFDFGREAPKKSAQAAFANILRGADGRTCSAVLAITRSVLRLTGTRKSKRK